MGEKIKSTTLRNTVLQEAREELCLQYQNAEAIFLEDASSSMLPKIMRISNSDLWN